MPVLAVALVTFLMSTVVGAVFTWTWPSAFESQPVWQRPRVDRAYLPPIRRK